MNPDKVRLDKMLTKFSVGVLPNQTLIGEDAFPTVYVREKSGVYPIYPVEAWFANEANWHIPGDLMPTGQYAFDTGDYACQRFSFKHVVPLELINNSDNYIKPMQDGTNFVRTKLALFQEVYLSELCMNISNWSNTVDVEGGWAANSTVGTNTFIKEIKEKRKESRSKNGVSPNRAIMDEQTFIELTEDATILDRIRYGGNRASPSQVNVDVLKALTGLDQIFIARSQKNVGARKPNGEYESNMVDLWEVNKNKGSFFMYYSPPSPSLQSPATIYTINWTGLLKDFPGVKVPSGKPYRKMVKWFDNERESWILAGSQCSDFKIADPETRSACLFYDTHTT